MNFQRYKFFHKGTMRKSQPLFISLALTCLVTSVQAKQLCVVQNASVKVSIHSNTCQADSCRIKFQSGRNVYFEFHPAVCADGQDFVIRTEASGKKAKPRLVLCDGNASCPTGIETNGRTQSFEARGKTWGTISY